MYWEEQNKISKSLTLGQLTAFLQKVLEENPSLKEALIGNRRDQDNGVSLRIHDNGNAQVSFWRG